MAVIEKEFTEMEKAYWNSVPASCFGKKVWQRAYTGLVIRNGMAWGYVETRKMVKTEETMKQEVEDLLGCEISDEQFQEALECAKRKQDYIYQREQRPAVLQRWYLVNLTEEYVRSLAFSKFTLDLSRTLMDMEKEHSANCQSALYG